MRKIFKYKYTLLLSTVLFLGFALRMYRVEAPIADWHAWRQVDTAAVTKFLLKDGEIFYPKYNDISRIQTGYENSSGYRFVEFPVFNIIHAFFFQTLPVSFIFAGRLVSVLAAILTSLALYFISSKSSSKLIGLFASFFYLTLPFNIYFTRVILPDPLSVAFGVWSVYIFLLFTEKRQTYLLYLASAFFALALLAKPHAIFFAIPIIYLSFFKYGFRKTITNVHMYLALDLALIPLIAWRGWMNYGDRIVGIPKLDWALNGDGIRFKPSFWRWIFGERIGKLILGFWGLILLGVGIAHRKSSAIVSMFILSAFAYVSIFATANVKHDYYQIFIIPAIALAMAHGIVYLNQSQFSRKIISIPLTIIILGVMYSTSAFYIRDFYKINNTQFFQAGDAVERLTSEDALVIAPNNGDTMFLYHTGRQGWPVVTTSIDKMIEMGADYYVSINKNDADTSNFKNMFETLEETDNYIVLDLNNPK